MERIKFEQDHISAVFDDVARRLRADSFFLGEDDLNEDARAMLQGVWSVFYALASNWPDVRSWIDELDRW